LLVRVVDAHGTHEEGRTGMSSSGKKKTTMAKLTRESKLRERRMDKQAKKNARKLASLLPEPVAEEAGDAAADAPSAAIGETGLVGAEQSVVETVVPALTDA
jgi:hypothetical protein